MKKEIEISLSKDDDGKDEAWCNWYNCPNCKPKYAEIMPGFSYCPNCGVKLKWVK